MLPVKNCYLLAAEVEGYRLALLVENGRAAKLRADVAEMRARLAEAKPAVGAWEAKLGPGRLMDVELAAQMMALIAGSGARRVERQLAAGVKAGKLSQTEETVLLGAYMLCWQLQAATRLLSDQVLDPAVLGEGARAFLLRETGEAGVAELTARLAAAARAADLVISARMAEAG